MTTQQLNAVQRYKVGYSSDAWGDRSSTPTCIPAHDGAWVSFSDMQALQAGYDAARLQIESLQSRLDACQKSGQDWAMRVHALEDQLSAIGAGGVEPLRKQAAPANVADERAAFEAWWRGYTKSIKAPHFEGGAYIFPVANTAWNTWQAARRAPVVLVPQGYKITEEQHVAAVKVLHRAAGVDGLPQRMIDAMLAAAPQPPEAAQLDDINAADMHQVFDLKGEE